MSLLSHQRRFEFLYDVQPKAAELLSKSEEDQHKIGYFHTLREICQQPSSWTRTCEQMIAASSDLHGVRSGIQACILTGSGSSEFAGDCVSPALRRELGVVTEVIGGGRLLISGVDALPPIRPALVISLARSGDSPESVGVVSQLLEADSAVRHLIITCNRQGRLANTFDGKQSVRVIALDDATNDRSLVMTSSFTNLLLAARFIGLMNESAQYRDTCEKLSTVATEILIRHFGSLSSMAGTGFRRAIFLGSGSSLGAAREASLKMLEMTAGAVATLCDSYLGFRHGPMSFAHSDTLIVCFLSSNATARAYECDLLRELNEKELGHAKVIVGEDVPADVTGENDLVIDCPGLKQISDDDTAVVNVLVGQLLAFFRCLVEGLRPDSPSENGVINRVVRSFTLHANKEST